MLLNDTDYPKDWPVLHLDQITKRGSGHTPSKSHPEYWNGNIKWVSLADSYRLNAGYISDTEKKISPEGIKNSSAVLYPPETVILSRDAGVGKSAVTKETMAVSQHFIAWNCNQVCKVAPWFLYYTLQFHQKELERQAVGSTIKTIGLPFFKKLEIALPPLPEQKKIATILSTWDRAIEGTEKLLANSQQQKKALMQQLLTGKKRLPGFTEEWKSHTLSELAAMSSGGTPLSTQKAYFGGNIPWVSIADMTRCGKYISQTEKTLTKSGLDNSSAKIYPRNTVLYAMYASIGECSIASTELSCSQAILGIRANSKLYFEYLYFYLSFLKEKVKLLGQTGTQSNLNAKMVKAFHINLPPLPEQKVIAAVFTTADEEITALQSDLSRLRQEKKALMQQLLTGKRRVTVD